MVIQVPNRESWNHCPGEDKKLGAMLKMMRNVQFVIPVYGPSAASFPNCTDGLHIHLVGFFFFVGPQAVTKPRLDLT